MWLKQQTDIAIFPRTIKCLRYSYKGDYFIRFQLLQQSQSGTITSAYPRILPFSQQLPDNNKKSINNLNINKQFIRNTRNSIDPTNNSNSNINCNINCNSKQHSRRIQRLSMMVSNNNNKLKQNKNKSKKIGQIVIEDDHGYFQTKEFNMYFQNQEITHNDFCLFRIQSKYKNKQNDHTSIIKSAISNPKTKVYLNIQLFSLKNQFENNQKGQVQIIRKKKQVCSKRIYLNLNYQDGGVNGSGMNQNGEMFVGMNQFTIVQFNQPQYFTQIQLYIGSVHLGWKLRGNKYSMCEFISLSKAQQIKVTQNAYQKKVRTHKQAGKIIRKLLNNDNSLQKLIQFHRSTIIRLKNQYQRISQTSLKINPIRSQSMPENWLKQSQDSIYHIIQQLKQYYGITDDRDELYCSIFAQAHQITTQLENIWRNYCRNIMRCKKQLFSDLCKKNKEIINKKWRELSVKHINEQNQHTKKKNLIKQFSRKRMQLIYQLPIYQIQDFTYPMISLHGYSDHLDQQQSNQYDQQYNHLVVMMHGYQGSHYDLQKFGNQFIKTNDKVEVLYLKCLQQVAQTMNIDEMGESVAKQIKQYLLESAYTDRISFVGYSLGGLILRSALSHLRLFKSKMNIYVSLSTPHLGVFHTDNKFVKMGVWYLHKLCKDKAITQLNTQYDYQSSQKTYLKSLSQGIQLQWFNKIILVTSKQDQFVPYYSSSISLSIQNRQAKQMSQNIRSHITKLQQVQIWFNVESKAGGIDRLTGRQSHIQFLDNQKFIGIFFALYGHQF